MERELCMKYMPIAQAHCAKGKGHKDHCRAPGYLEQRRRYREDNPEIVQAVYWRYQHSALGMLAAVRGNAKQRGNR